MYVSRKRGAKSVAKGYKRAAKRVAKPSKALVKQVQSIIHKDVETKEAFWSLPFTSFNSGVSDSGDIIQILPNISNGTSDAGRVGDQIRGMSLNIKGHMLLGVTNTTSTANSRIAVRMMIVQPRMFSSYANVVANRSSWSGSLLKKGGTTTAFTGTISDLYAPINKDAIISYYDKIVYVTIPAINLISGTTNVNTAVPWDLAKSCKFFNISLKMRNKLLKYDSSADSGILPTNYSPVFLLGYVHLDGSAVDVVNTQVSAAFDAVFRYEDA